MIGNNGQGNPLEYSAQPAAVAEGLRLVDRDKEQAERREQALRLKMSAPGMLGLSKCLDAARVKYGIPDSAFDDQPIGRTVYVRQQALQEGETYKGSSIILPESTRDRELRKAPMGILVSAGLQALDYLWSYGIEPGHLISFVHSAPYFIRYDNIAGVDQHLVVLDMVNVKSSRNLAADLKARRQNIKQETDDDGNICHVLVNEDRVVTKPLKVED